MELSPLATLLIMLITAAILHKLKAKSRQVYNLPPGPSPWPVIGNFNLIGALPHRSIHELSKKYGPLMHHRFGSFSVVVGSSVDMAKCFLKIHDVLLLDRPRTAAGKHTTYNYTDITWSPYGAYWRHARKICATQLFSPSRLASFEHIRTEEVQALMRSLFRASASEHSGHLNKYYVPFPSQHECHHADGHGQALMLLNGVPNIGDWIPWLDWLDLQGYIRRMKKLGKMVGVKAFTQDLIAGGTESSSLTVEWAMSELLRKPTIFAVATEELDRVIGRGRWVTEKDIPHLLTSRLSQRSSPHESPVRTQPLVAMTFPRARACTSTCGPLGGTPPCGMRQMSLYLKGLSVARWTYVKGQDFELLPFSSDRRMCPGSNLGLKMIQLILANLLHGFTWRLPDGMTGEELSMDEVFGLLTTRKFPLKVLWGSSQLQTISSITLSIGNFNLIGALPHRSLHELSKKYGPLMHLRFGSFSVVVGSSVDTAKFFFKTHDKLFLDRHRTAAGKHTTYDYSGILWSPYGAYWRQARRICAAELLSPHQLASFELVRADEVRALVRGLFFTASSCSSTVHLNRDYLAPANMNVITRMVLGKRFFGEGADAADGAVTALAEFMWMMEVLMLLNGVIKYQRRRLDLVAGLARPAGVRAADEEAGQGVQAFMNYVRRR
ncbi:hypothetical protein EJB05_48812, partial [Eragrostis curvula]